MQNSLRDTDSTGDTLKRLMAEYEKSHRAASVNFRALVPSVPSGERASHYIHPYPAKLLPHIPAFFLSNTVLCAPGETVLDPFCGSGTVLLESGLHDRQGIGADSNPLARLIARTKVRKLSADKLELELSRLLARVARIKVACTPPVDNIDYWFYPHVVRQLARLRRVVDEIQDPHLRDFFAVTLSACIRRVSLADPRLSVPVRLRENQYPVGHAFREATNARLRRLKRQDVFAEFAAIGAQNIRRMSELKRLQPSRMKVGVVDGDARRLCAKDGSTKPLPSGSIDMVLTSPPYAGAQKYIRASSLSLGWLGLMDGKSLRQLEDDNIGREHFQVEALTRLPETGLRDADEQLASLADINPLRAHIAATYLSEISAAFSEIVRVLKPGGIFVLVAGNNRVCGREFNTQAYLKAILRGMGLISRLELIDDIRSRGLMTRRNATASVITREWVHVLEKTR